MFSNNLPGGNGGDKPLDVCGRPAVLRTFARLLGTKCTEGA